MDSWDRFNKTLLPAKKVFNSKLNLEDISDKDKCIEIYGLDPSYFLSAPGLAWQACKKNQM